MRNTLLSIGVASVLGGCASVVSMKAPSPPDSDGLVYYMPKRDILVTLTVEGADVTKAVISATPAYPDTSTPYVLSFAKNLVGKNTLDVGITEQGLLSSAHSTTVSGVGDAFKGLAAAAGAVTALAKDFQKPVAPAKQPCAPGEHVFLFEAADQVQSQCNALITIRSASRRADTPEAGASGVASAGIFYRQNLPYVVVVDVPTEPTRQLAASLQFSPSQSPAHFLPVARTLFSNNDAKVSFVDGVPTSYTQDTDGEAVALLKLPADVIGSYFSALGDVFDAFKTNSDKQVAGLTSALQLQMAQRKYEACVEALKAKDTATLTALGC